MFGGWNSLSKQGDVNTLELKYCWRIYNVEVSNAGKYDTGLCIAYLQEDIRIQNRYKDALQHVMAADVGWQMFLMCFSCSTGRVACINCLLWPWRHKAQQQLETAQMETDLQRSRVADLKVGWLGWGELGVKNDMLNGSGVSCLPTLSNLVVSSKTIMDCWNYMSGSWQRKQLIYGHIQVYWYWLTVTHSILIHVASYTYQILSDLINLDSSSDGYCLSHWFAAQPASRRIAAVGQLSFNSGMLQDPTGTPRTSRRCWNTWS